MTASRILVDVTDAPYEVLIGPGLLDRIGQLIRGHVAAKRVALITDEHVAEVCGREVEMELARAGFETHGLTVAAGERSKSWAAAGSLLEALAERGLDRSDAVVALGGGVIGDLAGFVAATYLRGIDLVQVPTTLLAMVDAGVGGKTAVDLAAGKNLAGAFKQPRLVIMDTETLRSLSDDHWRSGLAEIAKSAIIDSEQFLRWIEANSPGLVSRDPEIVAEAVRRSVEFKARVVAGDEREEGGRECLNYGHTFGHAIEKVAGYGRFPHGLAVAEGMRFAVRVAEEMVGAEPEFVSRQDALLDSLGLRTLECTLPMAELMQAMRSDKKSRGGKVRFVLAQHPGSWSCIEVPDDLILGYIEAWNASKEGES